MLSFLLDNLCFMQGPRTATLGQTNAAPIAVIDPLTVLRGLGPVTVNVLDNDIDPEGQPLTLISAFAALGTAVAEADNTVTYSPPQGPGTETIEFDTVTYEIEDAEGARDTGQIEITISDPQVTVTARPGNTLDVSAGSGPIEIIVTDPASFSGTYTAELADLAGGPVNLVPPAATGTVATGEVLTAAPGLWIYATDAGTPARTWQWQRGGADIPGATAASYTVAAGDLGSALRVLEGLSDANGARTAASGALGAFGPAADAALIGWWDAADTATLTAGGDGAVSAWADKAGGAALTQNQGARQPTTGIRSLGGLNVIDFDGGDHLDRAITLPASGDVAFHMALAIDTTANAFEAVLSVEAVNDFQIDAANAAAFDGRLNATGIAAATPLSGGPFSGATILSVVCDFTGAGTIEVFVGGVLRAVAAYTAPLDAATALHVMTNRSKNAWVNGAVAELAVTGDVASRADYHAYLAAKWGLN